MKNTAVCLKCQVGDRVDHIEVFKDTQ